MREKSGEKEREIHRRVRERGEKMSEGEEVSDLYEKCQLS
jgi:hypothetical protein